MATIRRRREKRERLSAKDWADRPDSGFVGGTVRLPDGTQFFTVKKAGAYRLEILPYPLPKGFLSKEARETHRNEGDLYFELTFWIHRGVGADNQMKVCPRKMLAKPCPICEYRSQLTKEDDPDEDLIKSLAPKQRQLWNILDHADREAGVQVWDISYHLFGKQLKARVNNADEEDEYEYFADQEDGKTLRVGFSEESFAGNTYYEAASIDFKTRSKALDPELFDKAIVLDDVLIIEEYEVLKALFLQTEAEDKDDRKDDKPEKEKKKSPAKPKEEKILTAKEAGLEKSDEVEYGALICEIVKISGDGTSLTLMDADDEIHKAVAVSEVTKLDEGEKTKAAEAEAKTPPDEDKDDETGWADDEWADEDDDD